MLHRLPLLPPEPRPTAHDARGVDDDLRVLVVAESFLPQVNGVTRSVCRVLDHLAAEGHHAEVVAPTGPPSYAGFPVRQARGACLPLYPDFRIGLETRRRLRTVMRRFRPDVVHLASPAALGLQAVKAAHDLGVPSVAVYQTDLVGFAERYPVAGGARAMARLTRSIHRRADLTLAPSSASLAQLEGLGVPRTRLWPRGVDLVGFHPRHRDEALRAGLLGGDPSRVLVGFVGRLAAEKELDLLAVVDADPRYQLVVVGGGPDERRLRGVLPEAVFLGVLHGLDLSSVYASLDVFVHTGRHETYCQSAQEALASGVPVVAPRAGGPVDVVDDTVTGFLYPPGDAHALASYVDRLAGDPGLRHRMALAARRAVADRSWDAVTTRLVGHYREVCGRPEPLASAG